MRWYWSIIKQYEMQLNLLLKFLNLTKNKKYIAGEYLKIDTVLNVQFLKHF